MCQNYSKDIRVNAIAPGFFLTEQNRFLLTDEKTGELTPRGKTDHRPHARWAGSAQPQDLVGTRALAAQRRREIRHGRRRPGGRRFLRLQRAYDCADGSGTTFEGIPARNASSSSASTRTAAIRYDGDQAAGVLLPVDDRILRPPAGGAGGPRVQGVRGPVLQDARGQPAQDPQTDPRGTAADPPDG